jgi:hypothetical protein
MTHTTKRMTLLAITLLMGVVLLIPLISEARTRRSQETPFSTQLQGGTYCTARVNGDWVQVYDENGNSIRGGSRAIPLRPKWTGTFYFQSEGEATVTLNCGGKGKGKGRSRRHREQHQDRYDE